MPTALRTFILASTALIAFAANSVLCRMALASGDIDPASFTIVRLVAGALMLTVIFYLQSDEKKILILSLRNANNYRAWIAPIMLFSYAVFFSFAYTRLNTATGALILFATVQLSMIGSEVFRGKKLTLKETLGILISSAGFVLLMLPQATRPSIIGFAMMMIAGIAWAIYTLKGKGSQQPLLDTTINFIRCIPMTVILLLFSFSWFDFSNKGILLAILSGAIASGIGYAVWYSALKNLSITQAAISQLTVPIIAALGGVVFLGEGLSMTLMLSTLLVLSGIALVNIKSPARQSIGK